MEVISEAQEFCGVELCFSGEAGRLQESSESELYD
jgi:hypothetical protein